MESVILEEGQIPFILITEVISVICTSICHLASHSNHPYLVPTGSTQLTQGYIVSLACPQPRESSLSLSALSLLSPAVSLHLEADVTLSPNFKG